MNETAGVVLVRHPQFDKIVAKTVLERYLNISLPVVEFWESNEEPRREIFEEWEKRLLIPIDIGKDKYHARGTTSALESVIEDFDIPATPELQNLYELAAKNNKSGFLKGFHGSIVWILRELYKMDYDPVEVIERVTHAVNCFLDASLEAKRDSSLESSAVLCRICRETSEGNFEPFTISRYIRDMWQLGIAKEEIFEKAQFWLTGWRKAKDQQKEVKSQISQGHGYRVVANFRADQKEGILVESDNPFIGRELLKKYRLVIVRSSSGNVVIQTAGGDFFKLADKIKHLEPNCWFFDARLPAMMNGSRQYRVQPTKLSSEDLVSLVQEHVTFKRK